MPIRSWLFAAVLSSLAACASAPTAPSVPLNEQFTLAAGDARSIEGTALSVTFLRISGDSRCPADAICIQGGDAIVHVRADAASTSEYELHTGDSSRATVTHAGYRIALTDVQPYPFSSRPPIQPGDYHVTLVVSR